jgi:hypothetical protein
VRNRRARLVVAAWVAVFTAASATLNGVKTSTPLAVTTGTAALLGLIMIAILTTAEQRAERQSGEAEVDVSIDLSPRERSDLIDRVWSQRIINGLDRSLQHAVDMQLGLREAPELIKLSYQQTPGHTGDRVDLVTAYQRAGRQLVILGPPGSGKTTQALVLMRHLLDIARRDPSAPVPEIFHLASWVRDGKPLLEWLSDQLQRRHGYRPSLGRSLLVRHQIVPVLDGLDEVVREHRADCAAEITRFWMTHRGGPLVLCSRLAEYEELAERFPFGDAVTVEGPSAEQVQRYLAAAGPAWEAVRASLAAGDTSTLRELLGTPLMLSVAVLAYQNRETSELCTTADGAGQARQLWAAYVGQMRMRSYDPVQPSRPPYTEEQTVGWLGWLASAMRTGNETEFWLHQQIGPPTFLRRVRRAYGLVFGLVFGLVVGLLLGLVGERGAALVSRLIASLLVGLSFGLLAAQDDHIASPAYRAPFDVRRSLSIGLLAGLRVGLLAGLIGGLIGVLITGIGAGLGVGSNFRVGVGLSGGLIVGLVFGLSVGLVFALSFALIDFGPDRSRLALHSPTQVIADSAGLGVVFGLGGGLVFGLVFALSSGLGAGLTGGLGAGLIFGLVCGLGACADHYVYRLMIWRRGWAPLRWPRFLDWACSHLYLRSSGPAYQWMHLELRDYLADVYVTSRSLRTDVGSSSD